MKKIILSILFIFFILGCTKQELIEPQYVVELDQNNNIIDYYFPENIIPLQIVVVPKEKFNGMKLIISDTGAK